MRFPLALTIILTFLGTQAWHEATRPTAEPSKLVFVGDSLTAGLDTEAIVPGAINLGIRGQDTAHLLAAMPNTSDAELVVLTIGTNDVGRARIRGIEGRLQAISDAIPGPLLWNAVPPNARDDPAPVNAVIARICARRHECRFMQTPFEPGDFNADGIHLNARGYARWTAALRAQVFPAPD